MCTSRPKFSFGLSAQCWTAGLMSKLSNPRAAVLLVSIKRVMAGCPTVPGSSTWYTFTRYCFSVSLVWFFTFENVKRSSAALKFSWLGREAMSKKRFHLFAGNPDTAAGRWSPFVQTKINRVNTCSHGKRLCRTWLTLHWSPLCHVYKGQAAKLNHDTLPLALNTDSPSWWNARMVLAKVHFPLFLKLVEIHSGSLMWLWYKSSMNLGTLSFDPLIGLGRDVRPIFCNMVCSAAWNSSERLAFVEWSL